jgi:hypothetical protein
VPITIDQARDAKQGIRAQLKAELPVVGVGLTKRGADYAVKVNLAQAPAGVRLPTTWRGVPLVFEVVGPIRARL